MASAFSSEAVEDIPAEKITASNKPMIPIFKHHRFDEQVIDTVPAGTPADVEAEVREKVAVLAPGGGWLLGSSNSIPDFVPVENYRAMIRNYQTAARFFT